MFALLPLLLDALCLFHVVKTGRDRMWVYLIVMVPVLGAVIYIVSEVLPEYMRSHHGRQVTAKAVKKINPERELRRHANNLEIADTVQNRIRLAEENIRLGRYDEAAATYRAAMTGIYADDIALLMGLSRATSALGLHAEALAALDKLRSAHPDFQSHDAHLIYAISLEGLGRNDEALEEFAALADYAPGEETRCRYAMLLQRTGHEAEAQAVFQEIVKRADRGTYRYAKAEKEWIDIARRNGGPVS